MPKVLIGPAPLAGLQDPFLQTLTQAGLELVYPKRAAQMTEAELLEQLPGCVAVLAGSEPYTARVFSACPDLRVVARAGVGYDAVDLEAATLHGVAVTFAPGTNHDSVAEHTFMLIVALARNLLTQHKQITEGRWPRYPNRPLRGQTLGLLGLGRIGKAVALRGKMFNMNVIAYDPYPDQNFLNLHKIPLESSETILSQADFVSLHLPLDASTRQFINAKTLSLMKPTAFLINTARGGLINETDLFAALSARKIAGAGLDVFEREPPGENPLLRLDNVVLTAHTAGVDDQSLREMARSAARSIVELLAGEWPEDRVVNPGVQALFRTGKSALPEG